MLLHRHSAVWCWVVLHAERRGGSDRVWVAVDFKVRGALGGEISHPVRYNLPATVNHPFSDLLGARLGGGGGRTSKMMVCMGHMTSKTS